MTNKTILPENKTGFTLIEIIIVLAIIGIIAAAIFVVVDPTKRFGDANNALRDSNCDQIEKCLTTIIADNNGNVPAELSALTLDTSLMLVTAGGLTTGTTNCAALGSDIARVDLASLIEPYIGKLPVDPLATTSDDTGYFITRVDTSVFTINHCYEYTTSVAEEEGGGGGFTCGNTVDYEGITYNTVEIGTQCWFADNLNVGTRVAGGTMGYSCTSGSAIKKYCYSNSEANCTTYGGLYTWEQVMCGSIVDGAQGICPVGWHVPTHNEITTMERAICTSGSCLTDFPIDTTTTGFRGTNEGTKLKVGGSSGFEALLAGYWDNYEATFNEITQIGGFWSSTRYSASYSWFRNYTLSLATIGRNRGNIDTDFLAYGVRCIQD